MRRTSPAVLALLALAGCRQLLGIDEPVVGDPGVTDGAPVDATPLVTEDGWASGTRLKLAWNDYRGVRADLTMFDAKLGVQCIAYAWADGKRYCAPRNFTPPFEGIGYLDEQCTQPVGYRIANECSQQSAPMYLTQARQEPCANYVRTKVFLRGALRTAPAVLYVDHDGACAASGYPASTYDFYELGEEIATSSFVELTEARVALDDRLDRIDYRGTDGSSYPGPLYDRTLATQCSLSESGTCAPTLGGVSGRYGDSSCDTPLASVARGCPAPRFGSRPAQPGCPQTTSRYFAVGSLRTVATPIYQYSGMTCTQTTTSPTTDYYEAPAEVTPAALARSVDAPPQGSAIALVHFGTGMERARASGAYDYTHATPCSTMGGRCLPATGGGTAVYSTDATCETPRTFAITTATVNGCPAPTPPAYVVVQGQPSGLCTTTYTVRELGARYTGPVYTGMPGSCSATSTAFDLYELGDEVPQVEFAVAKPTMDL